MRDDDFEDWKAVAVQGSNRLQLKVRANDKVYSMVMEVGKRALLLVVELMMECLHVRWRISLAMSG